MTAPRHVLVPLLVLALAAALWLWPTGSGTPIVDVPDDVHACTARLRAIHAGLLELSARTGAPPTGSGPAFLQALIASGVWPDAPEARERLLCPASGRPYAARDARSFPLAKYPSGGPEREPVAACDGGEDAGHDGCTNVLYSDGSVVTLLVAQEIERGNLPAGATRIPVGPHSPLADLRELTSD